MPTFLSRRPVITAAVALLAAAAAPIGMPRAQEMDTLRILFVPSFTGHLPVLIAEDAGIFRKHGIKAELLGSNEAIKPLLSGDADIMLPAPAVVAVAAAQGIGVKIISSLQSRITQVLMVQPDVAKAIPADQRSFPANVKALAGKKLGVSVRGGSVDLNLRYILTSAGLTPDKDVFVLPLGSGGAMVAAMRGKQVDGVLAFPPLSAMLLADGAGVSVVDLAKAEGPPALVQPFVVAAVLDTFLQKRPQSVERFRAALDEVVAYLRKPENRPAIKAIVAKRLEGINPALLDSIIDELIGTVDTRVTTDDIAHVNAVQRSLGILTRDIAPQEILLPSLMPK